jgi:signal transduction histidine kinase
VQGKFKSQILVIILMIFGPLMCFFAPKAFLNIPEYDFVIEEFNAAPTLTNSIGLPVSEVVHGTGAPVRLQGNLSIDRSVSITADTIYIPFYEGRLKFFANGTQFFDSDTQKYWQSGLRIPDALFPLPKTDGKQLPDISFSIENKGIGSVTLSKIYFGQEAALAVVAQRNTVYYENMRAALWGAEIFIVIVLITLIALGSINADAVAPIFIMTALIIGGIGIFGNAFPSLIDAFPYLVTFMSLTAFGLIQFGNNIFDPSTPPINKPHLGLAIAISVALLVLGSQSVTDMKLINLYFTLPGLLLIVLYVAAKSFYRFFWLGNKNSGIYFTAMMAILTTLGHDAAYRFGLISDGIILVHAGTVAVIFCVGTLYISVVARSRSQLAANNLILEKERLQSQAMMKVHSELHDGVLNYLSIVNILSQEKSKTALADIQKLSRFAINEVRVILGQRAASDEDLFTALGTLRQQIVDHIPHTKVEVDWSLLVLMDYPKISSAMVLEITRIIQEALHNAIVRAGCKTLVVSARKSAKNHYSITIENSGGKSFKGERDGGFGINNMMTRARKINAKIDLAPIAGGAILTIHLP